MKKSEQLKKIELYLYELEKQKIESHESDSSLRIAIATLEYAKTLISNITELD